jgi:hypothetical protein
MVDELQRKEATSRCPESCAGSAEVQMLERELGTMHESLNSWRDRMVALRLQEEEMQASRESLKALKEFWNFGSAEVAPFSFCSSPV